MQEPQDFQWPGCPQCEQWFLHEFVTEVCLSVLSLFLSSIWNTWLWNVWYLFKISHYHILPVMGLVKV